MSNSNEKFKSIGFTVTVGFGRSALPHQSYPGNPPPPRRLESIISGLDWQSIVVCLELMLLVDRDFGASSA